MRTNQIQRQQKERINKDQGRNKLNIKRCMKINAMTNLVLEKAKIGKILAIIKKKEKIHINNISKLKI